MSDQPTRAALMARIAAPLLSASIRARAPGNADGEILAQGFSADINRVVPVAQILIEALRPQSAEEHAAINALAAPVAAQIVAQNPALFGDDGADDIARLLKPSLNVLASFCDAESSVPPFNQLPDGLPRSLVALSPIVGCLSQYAFGKSPARRLTDVLDTLARAQAQLFQAMPRDVGQNAAVRCAVQEAAAQLFASHFAAVMEDGEEGADAQFKALLSQWNQSLSLLDVLVRHAVLDEDDSAAAAAPRPAASNNIRAIRPEAQADDEEGDEEQGGSGGGGGRANKAAYNPMSFFVKKGV